MLFLGSGSVIHGMEGVVGHDPALAQDMRMMGGLRKYAGYGDYLLDWLPRFQESHRLLASGRKMKSSVLPLPPTQFSGCWLANRWNYSFVHVRMYFTTFEGKFGK